MANSSTAFFDAIEKGAKVSLGPDELELLTEIQRRARSSSASAVRTGRISVSELMGCGDKNTEKKRQRRRDRNNSESMAIDGNLYQKYDMTVGDTTQHALSVDPATLLDVAGWKIPPLPPGLVSINIAAAAHEADRRPYPSALPTCIFEKAMKAAAIVHAGSQLPPMNAPRAPSSTGVTNTALPLPPLELIRLLPPLSPMFPLVPAGMQRPMSAPTPSNNPFTHGFNEQRMNRGNGFAGAAHHQFTSSHSHQNGINQQRNMQQNQKTRKPYFMPYMSVDAVNRGLANGDLIKGVLRVNQRNYEESFVDNPVGSDQQDILILGVHDRNRALHGDVVVVRVKDRNCWVVRDALYDAWRGGHLKARLDDNGQPLSIPPLKRADPEMDSSPADLLDLLIPIDKCVSSDKLKDDVPVSKNCKYTREQMLCIAAKMELERRKKGEIDSEGMIDPTVYNTISRLAIIKRNDTSAGVSQAGLWNCGASGSNSAVTSLANRRNVINSSGSVQRRLNYRILSDMPDEDWGIPDMCLQKTAEVVFISEQKNCRAAVGMLKTMADGNRNWALFSPGDSRMPRMMIPAEQTPAGFFDRPQDFSKFIYVARMVDWQATAQFARGKLYKSLGLGGDIDAETEGLLLANDVDTREFSSAALSSLPISEGEEWKIDKKEYKYRKDFRNETVFTIDPSTARDLDDALHIKAITDCDGKGSPGWEVGVHIADVTHFVQIGTELDHWAANRGTSVYLVHKVIPMLPPILCEAVCSLNPGADRLTFSVTWKMNDQGEVFDQWFGRSVICSCCKLSYEHAQDFIENPDKEYGESELPIIYNGRNSGEIKDAVHHLNKLASALRERRTKDGCLTLDQPKLRFSLDEKTGFPSALSLEKRQDSNKLVEEFMLLANISVAHKIESAFPSTALLRRHPPPKIKMLRDTLEKCEKVGFIVDGSSSSSMASSLRRYKGKSEMKQAAVEVLSHLLLKCMSIAVYFCTGSMKSKNDFSHYALSLPMYTHFTSPIRRYADVIVHRYLSAALGYSPAPGLTVREVETLANHCNDKKLAAQTVSETSADMFFGVFVKECGPLTERAVVLQVLDSSFDVLIIKYGIVKRVYLNKLRVARDPRFLEGPCPSIILYWESRKDGSNAAVEQIISLCTVVDVIISALPEPTKYQAVLKQPGEDEKPMMLLNSTDE